MAEFTTEIDIDPSEFVESCSKREIKELIECLVDDGHLPEDVIQKIDFSKRTSRFEIEFGEKLVRLGQKYYSISQEDENTIQEIFKKYL